MGVLALEQVVPLTICVVTRSLIPPMTPHAVSPPEGGDGAVGDEGVELPPPPQPAQSTWVAITARTAQCLTTGVRSGRMAQAAREPIHGTGPPHVITP
jgi:hypothetical protein